MGVAGTPHLLSIEDDADTHLLLGHLLGVDYDVTFVSSVQEALEVLNSTDVFDLLLVDISLGSGKSGIDLLHEITGHEDIEELPTIALTACAMPGDREDLLDVGFDEYVGKPFTGEELIGTIEGVLATF